MAGDNSQAQKAQMKGNTVATTAALIKDQIVKNSQMHTLNRSSWQNPSHTQQVNRHPGGRNLSNGSTTMIQGGMAHTAMRMEGVGTSEGHMSNGMIADDDINMACDNNNYRGNNRTKK